VRVWENLLLGGGPYLCKFGGLKKNRGAQVVKKKKKGLWDRVTSKYGRGVGFEGYITRTNMWEHFYEKSLPPK